MTRIQQLGGHPIEQHSSPNAGGTMSGHKGLVLHIAQGTYRGTIAWQMNPDQRYASGGSTTTSSTWIVGRQEGEWAQMVDTDRIAWCQRGGSRDWLSVELAGYAPAAPSPWQIEACAQLLAWAHRRYGVPLAVADHPGERGLGHHSMDREWLGEEWGHDSCPGTGVIAAKSAIVARAKALVAGEDDDVSAADVWATRWVGNDGKTTYPASTWLVNANKYAASAMTEARALRAELAAMRSVVEQLAAAVAAGGGSVDTAAILAGVDERLAALRAEMRDAVADLGEGGAAQVRADEE